ncbi:hypothetical protein SH668x_003107 [Planctomicrobium sp. SH668]|uniref:hypothetical protein n=1 Tax=Planctomicrobium sp. SH668 TaxID=3448126 RepID=UPI003F5AF853
MSRTIAPEVPASAPDLCPLDFTQSMARLCHDITERHEAFAHIDISRVAICFTQTRSRTLHGLQAKLTPMRFEDGSLTTTRRGKQYTIQRLMLGKREMSYILTFYLPRFFDQSFSEKFITILHELYHISPLFNGDIRRFSGRCHVHTESQHEYDEKMAEFAREYLKMNPPAHLYDFLKMDYDEIVEQYGGVMGLQVPIPKLIPLEVRPAMPAKVA